MPTKEQLIAKITNPASAKAFTKRELLSLMSKCGCINDTGGRGSAMKFVELKSRAILIFDMPHPQKELNSYQRKKTIEFLKRIGEIDE